jgi:hypothetical protein
MRASYIKDGGSYRPCIRNNAGKVLWESDVRCCNRDHSTSRGPSATDLARFVLEAISTPEALTEALMRNPPECIRRSIWDMETWRAKRQMYRWALAVAPEVKSAITRTMIEPDDVPKTLQQVSADNA